MGTKKLIAAFIFQ